MSSRLISDCKESGDAASSSPPTKRVRLSRDASADDDLAEGAKARRQSVATILPPDIWASTLSHLAFGDVKQCTAVDRYMAFEVSPAIKYDANFTLKLGVPIPERVNLASVRRRFRGVKKAKIAFAEESVDSDAESGSKPERNCIAAPVLHDIISFITPNVTSLKIVGLGDNCIGLSTALVPLRNHLEEISFEGSHVDLKTIALGLDGLRNLTRLEIILDRKMFHQWHMGSFLFAEKKQKALESFGTSIGILGEINLPRLAELKLIEHVTEWSGSFMDSPSFIDGLQVGIEKIRQLKTLKTNLLGFRWDGQYGIRFVNMLSGCKNLQNLAVVTDAEEFKPDWVTLGPHLQCLRALSYNCYDVYSEDIKCFVGATIIHLRALETLKIVFEDKNMDDNKLVAILSDLTKHPTLTTIILDVYFDEKQARSRAEVIVSRLQELTGDHVTVTVGSGGRFSVEFD